MFGCSNILRFPLDRCAAARNEMIDNRNDCQHQKNVNEARGDMESEKSAEPQQQEHNSDDSKRYLPPETIFATPSGEGPIGYLLALKLNTSNAVVGVLFMKLCAD
jgi:hypothetical protein